MKTFYLLTTILLLLSACIPNTTPKAVRIEITPGAVLFSKAGETQTFSAKAFDADGKVLDQPIIWSSSSPSTVSMSNSGVATASSNLGSAQIVAQVGEVKAVALVLVAQAAPGAVLIADEQVAADPQPVDPAAAFGVGYRYTVGLKNIEVPAVGSVVLARQAKPIAGKVVEVRGNTLVLEVVPITQLFQNLSLAQVMDLRGISPQLLDQQATLSKNKKGWRVQYPAQSGVSPQAEFKVGALACKTSGDPIGSINLTALDVQLQFGLDFDFVLNIINFEVTNFRMKASGQAGIVGNTGLRYNLGIKGSFECSKEILQIPVPLNGPLALLLGPRVPLGLKANFSGEISINVLEASLTGQIKPSVTVGFDYTPATGFVNLSDFLAGTEISPRLVLPGDQFFRIKAGFSFMASVGVALGNPFLSFTLLEGAAGAKLEGDLGVVEDQIRDEKYASDYKLKFVGELGLAKSEEIQKVMELVFGNPKPFNLSASAELLLAPSPNASSVEMDKGFVLQNEPVVFTVKLDPANTIFPQVDYNVKEVRVYRKSIGSDSQVVIEQIASVPGKELQNDYTLKWKADRNSSIDDAYFAFVITDLLPFAPLELAIFSPNACPKIPGGRFDITPIGMGIEAYYGGLNDLGQVVGVALFGSESRGFLWDNGKVTQIPDFNPVNINNSGQIVGSIDVPGGSRAGIWNKGTITDLGAVGGIGEGLSINDSGTVVGLTKEGATVWKEGSMTFLPDDGGSVAHHINNKGQIVGYSYSDVSLQHAVLWEEGKKKNILPANSDARGINNKGQVVGFTLDGGFFWEKDASTSLDFSAFSINDEGVVVGGGARPMIWKNGTAADLGSMTSGLPDFRAIAINNRCQILLQSGLLLTPKR